MRLKIAGGFVSVLLLRQPARREKKPRPAHQKAQPANRRNRPQPFHIRDREEIERAGENQDTREEAQPRATGHRPALRQHKQHDRVDEVIEHRLVPNGCGLVLRQQVFQSVCAKRPQRHGENAHEGRDADSEGIGHVCESQSADRQLGFQACTILRAAFN